MRPTVNQLRSLTGRQDAYALQQKDGSWLPVREELTDVVLASHKDTSNTVGTYLLDGDKARTLVFDIDNEDNALEQAQAIREELVRLGFPKRSVGIEFSGRKGYHVWLVLGDYVAAADLRRVGRVCLAAIGLGQ